MIPCLQFFVRPSTLISTFLPGEMTSTMARPLKERGEDGSARGSDFNTALFPCVPKWLVARGARVHNLKSVSVRIPHRKLVVFTGKSGSGKSSLAFDTIF